MDKIRPIDYLDRFDGMGDAEIEVEMLCDYIDSEIEIMDGLNSYISGVG